MKENDIPGENDVYNETELLTLIRKRTAYVGKITTLINKITSIIENDSDDSEIGKIESYDQKLDKYIGLIREFTTKYCTLESDERKTDEVLNYCTDQEFRVIQIRKSMNTFLARNSHGIVNYSSHRSSRSGRSNKSKRSSASSASYLAVIEKRKSTECAKLLAAQAEERAQREIAILEKKKALELELEKENVKSKVIEAKNAASIAEIELKYEEEACISSHSSSVSSKSISSHTSEYRNNIIPNYEITNDVISRDGNTPPIQINHHSLNQNAPVFYPTHPNDITNLQAPPSPQPTKQEPVDQFIDDLIEGQETSLKFDHPSVSLQLALKQEYESRHLPPIQLRRFDGDPSAWPEFIQNFRNRVHFKVTFDDNMRMDRLISVLDGDAKRSVESVGTDSLFYPTALKTLKRDFGNPMVVSHLKLKSVLDLPQIKTFDRTTIRRYHQQLKSTITWLLSMGYETPTKSSENLTKAVSRLPNNLRQEFYKDTGNLQFTSHNINLVFFEQWLDKKLRRYFNPIADIIANNDKVSKGNDKSTDSRRINTVTNQEKEKSSNENNNKNYKFSSGGSQVNKSLPGTQSSKQFNQSSSGNQTSKQGGKSSPSGTQNSQVNQPQNLQANQPSSGSQISQVSQPSNNPSQSTYKRKCWLCSENHRLMECEQFTSKSVADRILISQQQHLCYNCLSKGHSFDECQSTHTCKVDGCGKKHHTLLHIDKSSQKQSNTHYSSNQNHKTYLQVLPVIVSNGENFITTNALLDTGSDSTLIRQDVADKLRLSGMDQSLELSNVMSISKKMKSKLVKFNLSSSSHPNEVEISNAWVVPDLNLPVAQVNISELKEN